MNPTVSLPPGATTVTLTVSDGLKSDTDTVTITVRDTIPPTITLFSRTPANGNGWNNSDVTVTWTCADSGSGPVSETVSQTVSTEGENQSATGTCTDKAGNSASATVNGINIDKTPPTIQSVSATPATLWPPNHQMVPVVVAVTASDNYDSNLSCQIASVASNEPPNGLGDGDTAPDWQITDALSVNLRAERSGKGNGRIYTINVQCADDAGNTATGATTVTVPRDQGKKK